MAEQEYPPELSEERLTSLDWQVNHGSLLKLVQTETEHSVLSQPVGVSVSNLVHYPGIILTCRQCFPTKFPRAHFQQALDIQKIYNKLYCAVAEDEEYLHNAIKDLLPVEPLANALWGIYNRAKKAGSVQDISAGIFRSDYMLHVDDPSDSLDPLSNTTLKQVEFNSFSCAGATHANKVGDMHRYLTRRGVYNVDETPLDLASLPINKNVESLVSCLTLAHDTYGPPRSNVAKETAVLFLVQPTNFNIADERPIEYGLWNRDKPVPAYRLEFGPDVLQHTLLTESRELLFQPPWLESADPMEISVVYLRAGYEAWEYDQTGLDARLRLEKSTAIKCPSLLGHITTFKKIQQALTQPGALERFLTDPEAATIRETFVPVYPLDESKEGLHARDLAGNPDTAENFILKPSLEGGGHNVYGQDIPGFLASISESQWSSYILMERIQPPIQSNLLMGPAGIDGGEVVSELGVLGTCLWRRTSEGPCEMLDSSVGGWTFKTKYADVDEMSVVKGYGCFDTPYLVASAELVGP
ncbi:uncharacterized protein N7484_008106 [Penicillium longicatenatum]|uniref:uncharacterized protein n=1 Tax=Penicillium longicatenatum TaxID=1561947 RepID=UPI002547C017|nr:uncharacterized protein N7484_008106 [Penicillium longicatenatum]KAJ5640244.1 hypothetical protein N7484_008106 [Penicillium longicatenatum]